MKALDRYMRAIDDVRKKLMRRRLKACDRYYYDQALDHIWMALHYMDEERKSEEAKAA